jgi:hypothetical protein
MRKRKHQLIILLLLLISPFAKAQEFAPVGAKWYYSYENHYLIYESMGDTIIQGKKCNIIQSFYHGPYVNAFENGEDNVRIFLHTNGKKIEAYFPCFDQFYTYIDFDANPGDNWQTPSYANHGNCNYELATVWVDSVTTIIINGTPLKRMIVNLSYTWPSPHWWWGCTDHPPLTGPYYGEVTEIIGSHLMLFPRQMTASDQPYPCPLRCYRDSIFGYYDTGVTDSCNHIISSIQQIKEDIFHFSAYPNPSSGKVYLKGLSADDEIKVYNLFGKLVFKGNGKKEIEFKESGVYSLVIYRNNKPVKKEKIIITKD